MSDYFKHLETLGVSTFDSRAAADYKRAETADELHFLAGEHLAAHATSITSALRLPSSASVLSAVVKRVANARWRLNRQVEDSAFCLAAFIDLCSVRSVLREQDRWPELAPLLDQVHVMACAHRAQALKMTPEEKSRFHMQAVKHLHDYQDDEHRTPKHQVDLLMHLDGVDTQRVDKAMFIRSAIMEPSWLDPWALISHYDRVAALSGDWPDES